MLTLYYAPGACSMKRVRDSKLSHRLRPISVRIAGICRILPFSVSERAGQSLATRLRASGTLIL